MFKILLFISVKVLHSFRDRSSAEARSRNIQTDIEPINPDGLTCHAGTEGATVSINLLRGDQRVLSYIPTSNAGWNLRIPTSNFNSNDFPFAYWPVDEISTGVGDDDPQVFFTRSEWKRLLVPHSFRVEKITCSTLVSSGKDYLFHTRFECGNFLVNNRKDISPGGLFPRIKVCRT